MTQKLKKQADIKSRDQLTQLIWAAAKMILEDAWQVSSNQTIVYDVRIIDAPVVVLSVSMWFYSYNLYIYSPFIPSSPIFSFSKTVQSAIYLLYTCLV